MRYKPTQYLYHGKWMTVPQIALETGMNTSTVRTRIKSGKSLDDPVRTGGIIKWKGKMWTFRELSELSGITQSTLKYRISERGMTIEEAMTEPVRQNHQSKGSRSAGVEEKQVLDAWQCGERTIDEVIEITGLSESVVNEYLEVRKIRKNEAEEKREVLRRYGYA